jgi:fibronectin-binding autotransporter adhesin
MTVAQAYTGTTAINSGRTLALSGAGNLASSAVADSGIFDISGTATGATVASLSGAGTVALGSKTLALANGGAFAGSIGDGGIGGGAGGGIAVNAGTEILSGANSYTGTTGIAVGAILQIGTGGSTGALGSGAVTDNGMLTYNRSDTVTLSNAITGSGGVVQAGSGTLIVTSNAAYTGTTTISAGTLQVGAGGATGTISGAIVDNAMLAYNRSNSVTLATAVAGSGGLTQAGSGTLILTGTNSYLGATTVSSGTLQIGAGGTVGAVAGNIVDNAAVIFNRSDTVSFGGVISGGGTVRQGGSGNLILSSTNPYTGATSVAAGTLSVNGSIASSAVTVASGARLGGTGTVGTTVINSGGTLAPGNSIGTVTVNGNLSLPAGSIYAAEVSPSAADRTNVTGTATLAGVLALSPSAGSYTPGSYRLIAAGSVTGAFASVTGADATSYSGLNTTIQYSATAVDFITSWPVVAPAATPPITTPPPATPITAATVSATPAATPATAPTTTPTATPVTVTYLFGTYGQIPNQIAAGNALAAAAPSGALYTAMGALVGSRTASVPPALGLLAGDIRPSLRAAAIEDSRIIRDTLLDRMERGADGTALWGAGFGGYGSIAGDGNASALHHDNAGFLAGADLPVMPGVRLGVAGGYTFNSASTRSKLSTASGDSGHIAGYASYDPGKISLKAGGDYGFGTVTIARSVTQLGLAATGRQDQQTGQVFADLGYRIPLQGVMLQPHIGIAHITATGGTFAETDNVAALSGKEKSDSQTYALLGVRALLADVKLDDELHLVPRFDLGWQHALSRLTPGQLVTYQDAATGFLVLGTPLAQDAAALQLGFELQSGTATSLFVVYDASFSSSVENHGLRGGVDWRF